MGFTVIIANFDLALIHLKGQFPYGFRDFCLCAIDFTNTERA